MEAQKSLLVLISGFWDLLVYGSLSMDRELLLCFVAGPIRDDLNHKTSWR